MHKALFIHVNQLPRLEIELESFFSWWSFQDPWGGLDRKDKGDTKPDLRGRGLCLVPISCTPQIYRENAGSDYWSTPAYRGCLYRWNTNRSGLSHNLLKTQESRNKMYNLLMMIRLLGCQSSHLINVCVWLCCDIGVDNPYEDHDIQKVHNWNF